jgi:hypothetical protein
LLSSSIVPYLFRSGSFFVILLSHFSSTRWLRRGRCSLFFCYGISDPLPAAVLFQCHSGSRLCCSEVWAARILRAKLALHIDAESAAAARRRHGARTSEWGRNLRRGWRCGGPVYLAAAAMGGPPPLLRHARALRSRGRGRAGAAPGRPGGRPPRALLQ